MRMPLREWNWSEGVALYGLYVYGEAGERTAIFEFLRKWYVERMDAGQIQETVNATAPCFALMKIADRLDDERALALVESRVNFLLRDAARLANGAFEHTLTETAFGGQLWVDTLFMAGLFLTESGLMLDREEAVQEGINQFLLHAEALQGNDGLFYHGWDEGKGSVIGCRWARGNAWAAIVGVELLGLLPEKHARDKAQIEDIVTRQLRGLQAKQDLSGLWTTVVTEPGTYVETSAAAGIAYAVLKGVRLGRLDRRWLPMGERAYRAVCGHVDEEGVLRGVSSGTAVQRHPGEYQVIARGRQEGYGQGLLLAMLSEELTGTR